MTTTDIARSRLVNQQITGTKFRTAKEIVGWLGAVQAQDYAMAKWAVGLRLGDASDSTIERALDDGDIIRTHILRPTWHFVSADDIRWMLALTAPRINAAAAGMYRQLELNGAVFSRSNAIIEKSLRGGKHLTRKELMEKLARSGINTNDLRASHLMFRAELDGVVCSGSRRGRQFTYALLDERVPETGTLTREEALTELARRYFTSHGPATAHDFAWWSGLTVNDARTSLESIKSALASERIDTTDYWFADSLQGESDRTRLPYFLPSFDEFMVSYKDRGASLDHSHTKQAILNNGIFKPIVVIDGKVVGTWRRTLEKGTVRIETSFLRSSGRMKKKEIASATERFGEFLDMKIEIV